MAEAAEIFGQLGDEARWAAALVIQAHRHYFQGRFAQCSDIWEQVYQSAVRRNHLQHISWALSWKAALQLRMQSGDELDQAVEFTERAAGLLKQTIARSDEIVNNGVAAVAQLRRGDLKTAYELAKQTSALISESPPSAPANFLGYAGAAEVYLRLWEVGQQVGQTVTEALVRAAQQACKDLHSYARVFNIGEPRAFAWSGLLAWLQGKPRRAHKLWARSATEANRLQMPYELALVRFLVGSHTAKADGRPHLEQAAAMFEQMGAPHDLGLAQSALDAPTASPVEPIPKG